MKDGELDWACHKLKEAMSNPEGVARYELKKKLERLAKLKEEVKIAQDISLWSQVRKYRDWKIPQLRMYRGRRSHYYRQEYQNSSRLLKDSA